MSLTRSLDKAREAYKKKDKQGSILAHSQNKSAQEKHNTSGQYIKSAIYGGLDGTITTFSVVAGVTGASLSAGIIIIMSFANLIGDGISMAIGDYLSTKSEREYQKAEREREAWEVRNYPEGEKRELIEIYKDKGISEKDASIIVDKFSKNEKTWVDIMMVEELGIVESNETPIKNAVITFFSFLTFGFIPVLAYVLSMLFGIFSTSTFTIACVLTGLTLFSLGAIKSKFTGRSWLSSGLEILIIGGIASTAAYLVGHLLSGLA